MHIDKAWRNNLTRGIDHDLPLQREFTNRYDLVAFDGNVANGIKGPIGRSPPPVMTISLARTAEAENNNIEIERAKAAGTFIRYVVLEALFRSGVQPRITVRSVAKMSIEGVSKNQ